MTPAPEIHNTTKLKTSAEVLKATQGTKKKKTIKDRNKTSRATTLTTTSSVTTTPHESTREWSKAGLITSGVSTERLGQATSTTTIETISRDRARPTLDIGLKTIINKESMTGIAVAAEAQATVPGQVATLEAVIESSVRGLLSVPSLNFFKILSLMR
jgi:hypothetical protein